MTKSLSPTFSARDTWPMYRAFVGIAILCATVIVTVFYLTEPVITKNRVEALNAAIFNILPNAISKVPYTLNAAGGFEIATHQDKTNDIIYAGYDNQDELVGFAIPARGMGYQDTIGLLYTYSPLKQQIVGFAVLDSRETPGLGDRIANDANFLSNFNKLDVSLSDDNQHIAHPISVTQTGQVKQPWQIDSISGATVSSAAVAKILQQSTARWLPKISQQLKDLERGP